MQRSEQPSFDACQIFELMSFGRPNVEGLLGEIASISLTSGETEAEPVKIAIIEFSLALQSPGRRPYRHHPI
jgi:hypothetical protein